MAEFLTKSGEASSPHLPERNILVIGWGSPLRGDDSLGLAVAQALAERSISNVEVLLAHQLTPELAEALARCCAVVFIDASLEVQEVCVNQVEARAAPGPIAHHCPPAQLLAWTDALFGYCPLAWQVSVPIRDLNTECKPYLKNDLRVVEAVQACVRLLGRIQVEGPASSAQIQGHPTSATN